MKKYNLFLICILVISFTSCVVGRRVQCDKIIANIDISGSKSVSIATLDHRRPFVSKGKAPYVVGFLRSTIGIPYPVKTKSKKTLADDISNSISESFTRRGFKCNSISTKSEDSTEMVVEKLIKSGSELCILFLMNSWWTDSHGKMLLDYDITLSIYNKSGQLLKSKKFTENKKYIGGTIFAGSNYKKYIPASFKDELQKFFNDVEINKVLN